MQSHLAFACFTGSKTLFPGPNYPIMYCGLTQMHSWQVDYFLVSCYGLNEACSGLQHGFCCGHDGGLGLKFRFGEQFIRVNVETRESLREQVLQRLHARQGFALATINLDHLVKMSSCGKFLKAYQQQDMVVADGRPIVWLSKLAGRPVSLMPGSDMVGPLCHWAAEARAPVALVGSSTAALEDATAALQAKVPGLDVAWSYAPGKLDPEGEEAAWILQTLQEKGIGLCFLALGAPKQERMAERGRQLAPSVGFASVGAGLDFLGGHQRRAPKWVRDLALEWLWRALSSPLRLGPRYLKCLAILPRQIVDAVRLRFQQPHLYSKISRR